VRYFDLFDERQIKVYLYEDLVADAAGLVSDIFRFLDVEPTFEPRNISVRYNVSGASTSNRFARLRPGFVRRMARRIVPKTSDLVVPPVSEQTKHALISLYREDILELQNLLGRDLSSWLQ